MEDDGTLAPGKFYAEYPLWTLWRNYDEATAKKLGTPGGVIPVDFPPVRPPTGSPVVAIFSDEDLARRFIEETRHPGGPELVPWAILTPADMLPLVEHFRQKGATHVAIDISANPPSAQLHPIGEFIEEVRRS